MNEQNEDRPAQLVYTVTVPRGATLFEIVQLFADALNESLRDAGAESDCVAWMSREAEEEALRGLDR